MTKDEFKDIFREEMAIEGSVKYPEYYTDEHRHLKFETPPENLEEVLAHFKRLP